MSEDRTHGGMDGVVAALAVIVAVLVGLEAWFAPNEHPEFPWQELPGYPAALGLVSALLVVLLAKTLGVWALQRPEGHDG